MSLRTQNSQKRFSREGFKPIGDYSSNMAPNDATIDIPLEQVPTNGNGGAGLRSQGSTTALRPSNTIPTNTSSEKRGLFRGRRAKPDPNAYKTGNTGYDGEEDTINTMGMVYKRILNFSTFTRYLFYIIPLGAIIAVPIIVTSTAAPKAQIGHVRVFWFFTWVEIIWLSLWVSKIVAHYLPYVFQVLAGVVSSGVRKYSMVIKALEIPLSLVGWAVTSLATFKPLMTRNPDYASDCAAAKKKDPESVCAENWVNVVQAILAATVIASLIYLAEKTIIQLISINYHRKQFNSRIKDSKRNIWILGLLYEASRALFPMYCNEFAEEDYIIADQLNLSRGKESKDRSHHRSGSHTPMRVLQDIGQAADKVTSMFGNVAQEITGKQVFNPNSAHSIVVEALEKNRTAEALARRIWMSFVVEGRDALLQDDITDVMGSERKTEAEEAFWTIDRDGNGDISLEEMILTVTEFARERKSIASSMHDVDQAINVLDSLLAVAAFVIIILIYVAFLNKSFVTTLATTGTALLSLSFVFSVTCQEVLGSCIFLFVKHPFDIGDRIDLSTSGCANPEHFVVEHISLLFTVFRHVQGTGVGRICQIPNIVLNTLWIENISRSKAMTEQLEIDIAFGTSFEDLQILKNELLNFVTEKENSRDYQPTVDVDVLGTSDQSKLSLLVEVKHKSNWANETIRRSRRSKFMCALVSSLKTVPIYPPGGGCDVAGSAALPAYSVAISEAEAKEHAEAAAASREKARLVPTAKIEETKERLSPTVTRDAKSAGAGMTQQENRMVENLTNRDPANDPSRDDSWGSRDDSSTLGERPSIDRSDAQEIVGLMRRESSRGKRKPAANDYLPSIPTINEPEQLNGFDSYELQGQSTGYQSSFQPQAAMPPVYENKTPQYSTMPAPYQPPSRPQQSTYGVTPGQSIQMSQVQPQPQRSPSNPYRSASNTRGTLSPTTGNLETEDEWGNTRPYSGV